MGATSYSKVSKNPPTHHCSQNSVDIIKSLQSMTDVQMVAQQLYSKHVETQKVKQKTSVKKCKPNMKQVPQQLAPVEIVSVWK